MEIIDIENFADLEKNNDVALCLGFFDAFHLGHLSIFKKALRENEKVGLLSFDISPHNYLNHISNPTMILSLSDKADLLEEMGFSYFYVLRIDDELMNMTRDEFIEEVLKRINPKKIYCGEDYTFGKFAAGAPEYLSEFFDVTIVPTLKKNDKKISSRDIINFIEKGNVDKAGDLLGRSYSIYGLVVDGNHVGRTIGFPTANLKLDSNYVIPALGVYAGYGIYQGKKYKAIISVSTHPSIFELQRPIIEVHFINFEGNLYGKEITVSFISRLRGIIKFDSLDDLKEQLSKDREQAKKELQ